jgi:hypothetical protein
MARSEHTSESLELIQTVDVQGEYGPTLLPLNVRCACALKASPMNERVPCDSTCQRGSIVVLYFRLVTTFRECSSRATVGWGTG